MATPILFGLQPGGNVTPDDAGAEVEFTDADDSSTAPVDGDATAGAEATGEASLSTDAAGTAELEGDTNGDGKLDRKEKSSLKKEKGEKVPFRLKAEGGVDIIANGYRDKKHPFSQNFGKYSEFYAYRGNACGIWNPGEKRLVDIGVCGEYQRHTGNQTTLGSTYNFLGLGGRLGLNFDHLYKENTPLKGKVAFFSRFGLEIFLGAMIGKGTNNDLLLHNKNGFAWSLNPYLNVVNGRVGENVNLGLNLNWINTIGYKKLRGPLGDSRPGNTPIGGPGLSAVIGWGVPGEKDVEVVPEPFCEEDKVSVPELQSEIADLEAELMYFEALLGGLVTDYLEKLSKHPFDHVSTQKALRLGELVTILKNYMQADQATEGGDASELSQENRDKIQAAVKAAAKVDESSENAETEMIKAIAKATWYSEEQITEYLQEADKALVDEKIGGLWDLPEDAQPSDSSLEDVKSYTECDDLEMARGDLEDARAKLRERKGAVFMAYKHALHLAGLSLGTDDSEEILKATFLRVDSPNYGFNRPNDEDVDALKKWAESHKGNPAQPDDAELMKILNKKGRKSQKGVFAINEFEAKKIHKLAKWMNGEGKLPGEERMEKLLAEHNAAKGIDKPADAGKSESNAKADAAVEKAYSDWVTKLNLKVVGHTDSIGDPEPNKKLSQRRSDAIKYMLIGFGVDEARIESIGAGEGHPIVPEPKNKNRNDPSRIKNRRVEFVPEGQDATSTAPSAEELGDKHTDASSVPGKSTLAPEEPAEEGSE